MNCQRLFPIFGNMRSMKYKKLMHTHPFVSYAPSFLSENESVIEAACFFILCTNPIKTICLLSPYASPHAASFL